MRKSGSLIDSYFWINDASLKNLGEPLKQIKEVANTAIDEFVKVQTQRKFAQETLQKTDKKLEELMFQINSALVETLDQMVHQLADTRRLQGEVIDLKNIRYIDVERVDELLEKLNVLNSELSEKTIAFLLRDEALIPYEQKVTEQKQKVEQITKVFDAKEIEETNSAISSELDLLIDIRIKWMNITPKSWFSWRNWKANFQNSMILH